MTSQLAEWASRWVGWKAVRGSKDPSLIYIVIQQSLRSISLHRRLVRHPSLEIKMVNDSHIQSTTLHESINQKNPSAETSCANIH